MKDYNLGKAPTFSAFFRFSSLFFSCFSTRFFFSCLLCAKGSTPGSVTKEIVDLKGISDCQTRFRTHSLLLPPYLFTCRIRFVPSQTWPTLTKSIEKYSNNYTYHIYALSTYISWWIQCNKFGIVKVIIYFCKFGQSLPDLT